jgi:hypothetical protein
MSHVIKWVCIDNRTGEYVKFDQLGRLETLTSDKANATLFTSMAAAWHVADYSGNAEVLSVITTKEI